MYLYNMYNCTHCLSKIRLSVHTVSLQCFYTLSLDILFTNTVSPHYFSMLSCRLLSICLYSLSFSLLVYILLHSSPFSLSLSSVSSLRSSSVHLFSYCHSVSPLFFHFLKSFPFIFLFCFPYLSLPCAIFQYLFQNVSPFYSPHCILILLSFSPSMSLFLSQQNPPSLNLPRTPPSS